MGDFQRSTPEDVAALSFFLSAMKNVCAQTTVETPALTLLHEIKNKMHWLPVKHPMTIALRAFVLRANSGTTVDVLYNDLRYWIFWLNGHLLIDELLTHVKTFSADYTSADCTSFMHNWLWRLSVLGGFEDTEAKYTHAPVKEYPGTAHILSNRTTTHSGMSIILVKNYAVQLRFQMPHLQGSVTFVGPSCLRQMMDILWLMKQYYFACKIVSSGIMNGSSSSSSQ